MIDDIYIVCSIDAHTWSTPTGIIIIIMSIGTQPTTSQFTIIILYTLHSISCCETVDGDGGYVMIPHHLHVSGGDSGSTAK